jgi:hypothetical protein
LTLRDSEHESWDDRGDNSKHWQKSLGKTHGRGLGKDIETIFTLTRKKNCLGYEILDIKKVE